MGEAISPQREIKGELYRLTPSSDGVTAKSKTEVENFALRYTFAPIWIFQVPVGQEFVITPEHRFSAYLVDGAASEWRDDQKVRVEVWESSLKKMTIAYQGMYVESKEMADTGLMARLDLLTIPLNLHAGDWIYVCGHSWRTTYTITVTTSFFSLEVLRVRPGLYK